MAAVAGDGGGDGAGGDVRDLFGPGNEVYMRTQPLSPWPLPGGSLSFPSAATAAPTPPPRAPSAAEGRRLEAAVQLAQQLAAQTQDDDGAEHADNMPSGSGRTYKQPSARFARPTPSSNAARPEQHQQLFPPTTMYPTITPGTVCVAAFNMGPVGHLNTALQRKTDFQQPKQIACFSKSADGSVTYDDRQLRMFHPPKLGADLSQGIDTYIAKSRGKGVGEAAPLGDVLDGLLAHNASLQDVHFVTYRNNLNKILGTAYNRVDPWEMGVERHGSTIFLDVHQMDESHRESDWQRRCMYWGYSFERFCTAPEDSTEPVNANEEFCSILRTKLGLHRLVLAAEVDCYRVDSKQRRQFMELKTHGDLTTPKKAAAFEDRKLRHLSLQALGASWWAFATTRGAS
eukprot:jgi/Chlat1/6408/Chrsp45S06023